MRTLRTAGWILSIAFVVALPGCSFFQTKVEENREGMLISVSAGDELLGREFFVCREGTVSREGAGNTFDLRTHVRELVGENCGMVTFRCGENGTASAPQRICVGDPPVNTGCTTASGLPVQVRVDSVFR